MKMITSAAYAAFQTLSAEGLAASRSQLSEVIAALLGYPTLAALQVEEANQALTSHLDDAERFVLNIPLGASRAAALDVHAAVQSCIAALKATAGVPVHESVMHLYDEYAREALEDAIVNGEGTAGAMAESNADFPDSPDMEEAYAESGELWEARQEWTIEAGGTLGGEYDPEGDRMYNGHVLHVWGKLTFLKAGRAGIILADSEEGASPDDTWRSYPEEQEY